MPIDANYGAEGRAESFPRGFGARAKVAPQSAALQAAQQRRLARARAAREEGGPPAQSFTVLV